MSSPATGPSKATPWLALGLFALSTAAVLDVYERNAFSNDGAEYLSVARNLRAGRGLVTSILYYDEHYRLAGAPVPQTVFPPGFPVLIAATSVLGLPMHQAALVVNLCCYQLVALLLYRLSRRNGSSPGAASVLAVLWLLSVPAWDSLLTRGSEMPFIFLTLLSAAYLQDDTTPSMVAAGAAAAGCLLVRYAGVFWIAAAGLWLSAALLRSPRAKAVGRVAAFGVLPGLAAVSLFLRNHLLVGDAKGGNPFVTQKAPLAVLRRLARAFGNLSGFSIGGLAEGRPAERLLVVCVALCLVALGMRLFRREREEAAPTPAGVRSPLVSLGMTYIGVSLVLLLYLEMTTRIGLGGRLLLPLLPFLLLVAPAGLSVIAGGPRAQGWVGLAAAGVFLCGQAMLLPSILALEADAARCATVRGSYDRLVAGGALAPGELGDGAHPILTNEPHLLGEASGSPALGLTGPPYASQAWTTERVRELAERKGVRYVLYFPLPTGQHMTGSRAAFFESLASPARPEWLVPLRMGPSAMLYEIVYDGPLTSR